MSAPDNGGAAYPLVSANYGISKGMSLRDYFAAAVMPALVSRAVENHSIEKVAFVTSRDAYLIADAMLAERDK